MARPKKSEQQKQKKEDVLLAVDEVWDVLEFAHNLGGLFPGVYTPDLVNARLKEISYSPLSPSESNIDNAFANLKDSEEIIRSYIEYFEAVHMPFKRILSYMASHLAFDIFYTPMNVTDAKEYASPKYKKDQLIFHEFLDKFDYKSSFRNVVKQLLRNEIYVGCLREDKDKIVLQELPLKYCKITAKGSYNLLVTFDFSYFLQPGIDINLYDPFFQKKYLEVFKNYSNKKEYIPSLPPELRGNSQFAYWVDLPPWIACAFKLDTSQMVATPLFTGMLRYLVHDHTMILLQKDSNMAAASKILLGEVPLLKESKASVKDMLAIDPKTLGQFLSLVKASLASAIKVASAPLENMQAVSFDSQSEILDDWTRSEMSSSGMDTALIYSSQLKANLVDSQLSFQSDSKIVEQSLYPQFSSFLEYWINNRTSKYKYSIQFQGNDYYLDRQQRFDKAMELTNQGIVLPQLIAASLGFKPQELYRMMEETKANGFADMRMLPIASVAKENGEDEKGRPRKSDSELGDAGAQTRAAGSNTQRGGKPQ